MTYEGIIIGLLVALVFSNIMMWHSIMDQNKLFGEMINELIRLDRRLNCGRRNEKEPAWVSALKENNADEERGKNNDRRHEKSSKDNRADCEGTKSQH